MNPGPLTLTDARRLQRVMDYVEQQMRREWSALVSPRTEEFVPVEVTESLGAGWYLGTEHFYDRNGDPSPIPAARELRGRERNDAVITTSAMPFRTLFRREIVGSGGEFVYEFDAPAAALGTTRDVQLCVTRCNSAPGCVTPYGRGPVSTTLDVVYDGVSYTAEQLFYTDGSGYAIPQPDGTFIVWGTTVAVDGGNKLYVHFSAGDFWGWTLSPDPPNFGNAGFPFDDVLSLDPLSLSEDGYPGPVGAYAAFTVQDSSECNTGSGGGVNECGTVITDVRLRATDRNLVTGDVGSCYYLETLEDCEDGDCSSGSGGGEVGTEIVLCGCTFPTTIQFEISGVTEEDGCIFNGTYTGVLDPTNNLHQITGPWAPGPSGGGTLGTNAGVGWPCFLLSDDKSFAVLFASDEFSITPPVCLLRSEIPVYLWSGTGCPTFPLVLDLTIPGGGANTRNWPATITVSAV